MPDVNPIKAEIHIELTKNDIPEAKRQIEELKETAGSAGSGMEALGTTVSELGNQMALGAQHAGNFVEGVTAIEGPATAGQLSIAQFTSSLAAHGDTIDATRSAYEALAGPMGNVGGLIDYTSPKLLEMAKNTGTVVQQLDPLNQGVQQLNDSLSQSAPIFLPQLAESLHPVAADLQAINEQVAQTAQAFQGISFTDETGKIVSLPENMKVAFDNAGNLIGPAATYIQQQLNGANEAATQTTSAFNSADGSINKTSEAFNTASDNAGKTASGFTAINDAAASTNKTLGETGNVAASVGKDISAIGGAGEAAGAGLGEILGGAAADLGNAVMGVSNFVMPLMAFQMVGMAAQAMGQAIYDSAAIAEGPAAHSMGTFTGTVDALGQTMQKSGAQFSESFGQQVMPTLDAVNNVMSQSGGSGGLGGFLGGTASFLGNLGLIAGGLTSFTIPGMTGMAGQMVQAGGEGIVNQFAPGTFQGPGPALQAQVTYQQQMAALPQTVISQTYQAQTQTATLLADATNPAFLQSQDQLAASQQIYQRLQASYNASHPINQSQLLQNAQYQQYAQQQDANYNQQMQQSAPYDPIGFWGSFFGGIGSQLFAGGTSPGAVPSMGGCFPAGTKVLLANGDEKSIELLQVGEEVSAHDGTKQVHATITDRITFYAKQTYRLVFSNGNTLLTTDSHPIATAQGWKSISPISTALENPGLPVTTLKVGDSIHTSDGVTCRLVFIQIHEISTVFNITVDTAHTYYANNILVHNAKGFTSAGEGSQNVSLEHTFTATVNWVANGLEKEFTGVASWIGQGLSNTFQGVANWVAQGLANTFTGVANWIGQGLENLFTGNASWIGQNLENMFTGVANWTGQNLIQPFTAMATWIGQGLENLFTGKAHWIGQDLEHMFTAVAQWTAQNLTPNFTVNPSVTMLAEGTSNFAGGPAIVAEAGYPEVVEHNGQYSIFSQPALLDLPAGANVYPMKNLSSSSVAQFADGTGDQTIPITLSGSRASSMPSSMNIYLNIDGQTFWSATGLSLAQNVRAGSGYRGY